ncbi:MAG TPA: hypothetical protein VIK60_03945 [Vicinamibacterales bacterium]
MSTTDEVEYVRRVSMNPAAAFVLATIPGAALFCIMRPHPAPPAVSS